MSFRVKTKLDPKKKYLQIALNNTLEEARKIINDMPVSDRIIVEAGTPLIKRYGERGIRQIHDWCTMHQMGQSLYQTQNQQQVPFPLRGGMMSLAFSAIQQKSIGPKPGTLMQGETYIVADLKTMDRGDTEVAIAARGGASAAVALGAAPIETLNNFITSCEEYGIDAMIDMMNVEYPLAVLRELKKVPPIVVLHRGVDEERYNKQKMLPLYEIRRIKGAYDMLIAIAGGDTIREVKSAVFNDADIVVIWKDVYKETQGTGKLIESFLKEIR